MKNYKAILSSTAAVLVIFFSVVNGARIVHADSALFEAPPCSYSYDVPATCGYYSESFTLDNLSLVQSIAYVYRIDTNAVSETGNFSLATSTSLDLEVDPYKSNWSFSAFLKKALPEATGSTDPLSIVGTTTEISNYSGETYSTHSLISSPKVNEGLMDFVVPKDDEFLGLSALQAAGGAASLGATTTIDDLFVMVNSTSINPFPQTAITDPRREVHLFYSPLGVYKGKYIVVYKSKEADTLDDGSVKKYAFPAPQIPGVVAFEASAGTSTLATTTVDATSSVPRAWWMGFWCFVKGLFGSSC